jgi:hypothetical protein
MNMPRAYMTQRRKPHSLLMTWPVIQALSSGIR